MIVGNHGWRIHSVAARRQAVKDVLIAVAESHPSNIVFGICKHKQAVISNDIIAEAFEEICSRFDRYLGRLHKRRDTQRGIIIFDKASYESRIQNLATDFRTIGHSWGVIRNLSEVPLFLDSRASRLIQVADIVAWSINRKFARGDPEFFDIIAERFDRDRDRVVGFGYFPPPASPAETALS